MTLYNAFSGAEMFMPQKIKQEAQLLLGMADCTAP